VDIGRLLYNKYKVNVEFGLLKMDPKRGKGCGEGHRMQPLMWICVEPSKTERSIQLPKDRIRK
jgi:hypothetical protein